MTKKEDERAFFAKRLREAIEGSDLNGLSNKVIGKAFSVSGPMISYWMHGLRMPCVSTAVVVARRLHISFEWLMTGRGNKQVIDDTNVPLAQLLQRWWQMPENIQSELLSYASFLVEKNQNNTFPAFGKSAKEEDKPRH